MRYGTNRAYYTTLEIVVLARSENHCRIQINFSYKNCSFRRVIMTETLESLKLEKRFFFSNLNV